MTRHQYGIYALDPQTSFRGETVGGVQKCRLFFQATTRAVKPRTPAPRKTKSNILNFPYKKKQDISTGLNYTINERKKIVADKKCDENNNIQMTTNL